jgi:iron complex outermembrane receptor protein
VQVWSPNFAPGLSMALDWWKIRIVDTDRRRRPDHDPQRLLRAGHREPLLADAVHARPDAGLHQLPVLRRPQRRLPQGGRLDFDLSYHYSTEGWGDFSVVSNTTYTGRDYTVSTNDPRIPLSSVASPGTFRVRSNLNLGWNLGAWSANWMMRYYSGMKEGCTYFIPGSTEPNLECEEIRLRADRQHHRHDQRDQPSPRGRRQYLPRRPAALDRAVGCHDRRSAPTTCSTTSARSCTRQPSANVSYYGGFDIGRFPVPEVHPAVLSHAAGRNKLTTAPKGAVVFLWPRFRGGRSPARRCTGSRHVRTERPSSTWRMALAAHGQQALEPQRPWSGWRPT